MTTQTDLKFHFLIHEVLAPAHAQRAIATVAIDATNHVTKGVAHEHGLETEREAVQRRHAICEVTTNLWCIKGLKNVWYEL